MNPKTELLHTWQELDSIAAVLEDAFGRFAAAQDRARLAAAGTKSAAEIRALFAALNFAYGQRLVGLPRVGVEIRRASRHGERMAGIARQGIQPMAGRRPVPPAPKAPTDEAEFVNSWTRRIQQTGGL